MTANPSRPLLQRGLFTAVFLAMVAVAAFSQPAYAIGRPGDATLVRSASEVVAQMQAIPERCIPPALLAKAEGVAVFPDLIKAGFVIGARHGRGVLLLRVGPGQWSDPIFLTITGGSFGAQIGAQATDMVLVFNSRRGVENFFRKNKATIGADLGAAAGPVGRQAEVGVDLGLKSELYSYSRSRGLFAGATVEGSVLNIDWRGNEYFYGPEHAMPAQIGRRMTANPEIDALRVALGGSAAPGLPVALVPGAPIPVQPV
ncbi:MAG: lipid-binding SYLF domain-containing protein, partial [Planctomycetia bacterium]